jgi:rod shape-determining protein MreD
MLKFISVFFFFVAATIVHWIFIEIFSPFNIIVGVMLAFSLIVAGELPQPCGYSFAFFSGLFLDFFNNVMFGGYAFVFTIILFVFYKISNKIDFRDIGSQIVITTVLNMIMVLSYGLLAQIFTGIFLWHGIISFCLGAMLSGLLLPVLYFIAKKYFVLTGLTNK